MTPIPSRSEMDAWIAEQVASGLFPSGYTLPDEVDPDLPSIPPEPGGTTPPSADELAIKQNVQSSDYTLTLEDAGKMIFHPASDAVGRTWTIPANSSVSFPIGTSILIVNQFGSGVISLACGDTLRQANTALTGTRSFPPSTIGRILKIAPTEWMIEGAGIT